MNTNQITELANELIDDLFDKYTDVTDVYVEFDFDEFSPSDIDQFVNDAAARFATELRSHIDSRPDLED